MAKVNSLSELKQFISNGIHDYFIQLNFGLRSSKSIDYNDGKFYVQNCIDDTEQELTEEQMMDRDFTNIGYAIKQGAFFAH